MSYLLFLLGMVFLVSGLLSIAKISEVGLDFVGMSKIHELPFLVTFPEVWIYIVLGIILIIIAGGFSRKR